ncbi:DUF2339 domain-containing protein [Flavobacterium franklandianum]|uniref:DUF2339 domain-containing protein n=1 Tax=Flavobacterium franklandianum TaxID=2594430 RepID=UPI00117A4668|nr:DUF2339 domain-containing protein [Flavobacterium franklandianum]TRX24113.1 DUF2339 domain-containing protein [Flavobacterium franklandianum]
MEIFLLLLGIAFLFYIKNGLDSKFDRIEERIDEKFRELFKKIDDLKATEKLPENPLTVPEAAKPKVTPEELKPPVIFEKTEPMVFIPVEKDIVKEKNEKIVFSMDNANTSKHKQHQSEPKVYIPAEPDKTFWENFRENNPDLEKFIGENLINKIGILILVLGISYFVKYAIDKDWINEPARVGIGMLSGALIMGVAHKLRQKYAAFSSVFVAGAIAIFYFTIGIAFHSYHLFGQTTAFIIMILITVFSCFISLSYNRKELAVLSLIGGFAVPFMISTGQGNYVVLFTYILILNIGILALAYYKKWSIINILSYVFTVILYGAWLFKNLDEKAPHYLGALLFGFAFYLVFIGVNIINNVRTKGLFSPIELSILASNSFLFYGAGMVVLEQYHPELKGLFTAALGLLNLSYAWFLYKKFGLDKTAVYLLVGLTLTFMTLAIPIQFEGNFITLFWAAEAVILMWLAQKSKITYYRFASIIVHFLMVGSLLMDWNQIYPSASLMNMLFNKICLTGIFAVASLLAVYYLLKKEEENQEQFGFIFNPKKYSDALSFLGIILGYFVGLFEVSFQANTHIDGANSAITLPILYHLIFSTSLLFSLCKSNNRARYQLASIIAVINIVCFAFWFSNYAFYEHEQYITTGIHQRIGFYLHYISLLIIVFFGYKLYQINKENPVFELFQKKIIVWIAAFFIIYMASAELMLHGLVLTNNPVTAQEVQSSEFYKNYQSNELLYLKQQIAYDSIDQTRTQIIKTGYPILWGILAFIFLIIGIRKRIKNLRIIALSLLGITILKLFLFDINNASETGKIIAFILLGILILIISFVYQKIKVLVQDDNKSKETNETE